MYEARWAPASIPFYPYFRPPPSLPLYPCLLVLPPIAPISPAKRQATSEEGPQKVKSLREMRAAGARVASRRIEQTRGTKSNWGKARGGGGRRKERKREEGWGGWGRGARFRWQSPGVARRSMPAPQQTIMSYSIGLTTEI